MQIEIHIRKNPDHDSERDQVKLKLNLEARPLPGDTIYSNPKCKIVKVEHIMKDESDTLYPIYVATRES